MSAQPAGSQRPSEGRSPERAPRALRILGLVAVCLGVAAIAAATFVLSYSGIHTLALQARIAPRLARGYPLLIDAMLVIVLAAVLALRGAGLPSRIFAWVTLVAVLAAAAGADALHAAGRRLPDHVAAVTVAVVPWVLVLLAFGLLLAMLRYARIRRQTAARLQVAPHGEARAHWQPGEVDGPAAGSVAPTLELPFRPAAPAAAAPAPASAAPASAAPAPLGPAPAPVVLVPPTVDSPASDPAAVEGDTPDDAASADTAPADTADHDTAADATAAGTATDDTDSAGDGDPSPTVQPVLAVPRQPGPTVVADADPAFGDPPDLAADSDEALDDPVSDQASGDDSEPRIARSEDSDDPDMPVFHRMWSAPTPPAGM